MRYLLKDWGVGGTTSPLETNLPAVQDATPPAPVPLPPPTEEVLDAAARMRRRFDLAEETLIRAMVADDCPWSTKVTAASVVLDRGYGRVPQPLSPGGPVTINITGTDKLSIREKLQYGAEVLAVLKETEQQSQAVDAEFTNTEELEHNEAVNQ